MKSSLWRVMLTHRMPETLSIVGAGRVGRALGRQFHLLGWRIGVLTSRSITSARAAVRVIGAGRAEDHLTREVLASKVVLIATPDSAITIRCKNARRSRRCNEMARENCAALTSGALDSECSQAAGRSGRFDGLDAPDANFQRSEHAETRGACLRHGRQRPQPALKVAREKWSGKWEV